MLQRFYKVNVNPLYSNSYVAITIEWE